MKRNKHNQLYESIGWLGAGIIVVSYGLLALGVFDGDSALYHTFVLAGSAGVATISYKKSASQPFVLNVIFGVLALIALARIVLF